MSDVWILIRGLTRQSANWGNFPKLLQKQFPNSQFVFLDWPGFGKNNNITMPMRPKNCLAFFQSQLEQQVSKKDLATKSFGVLGISLGGSMALYWAKKNNLQFNKVIAINSALANLSLPWTRLKIPAAKKILSLMSERSALNREKEILNLTSEFYKDNQKISFAWANAAKMYPVNKKNVWRQLVMAAHVKVKAPLPLKPLILASKCDRLVPWQASKKLSHYFDVPLFLHEKAGHDLPLDDPKWCLEQIERYCVQDKK